MRADVSLRRRQFPCCSLPRQVPAFFGHTFAQHTAAPAAHSEEEHRLRLQVQELQNQLRTVCIVGQKAACLGTRYLSNSGIASVLFRPSSGSHEWYVRRQLSGDLKSKAWYFGEQTKEGRHIFFSTPHEVRSKKIPSILAVAHSEANQPLREGSGAGGPSQRPAERAGGGADGVPPIARLAGSSRRK